MPIILNIDTATETAIVSVAEGERVLAHLSNANQKDHSAFLQPAIKSLLEQLNIPISKLSAVAVTSGPGSYTGLRVGMASAKGLCYALKIPLVTIDTLEMMAFSSILENKKNDTALYCPMIDARRMEVFTAVHDSRLSLIMPPAAMVLDENAFNELSDRQIFFTGSGMAKLQKLHSNNKWTFSNTKLKPEAIAILSNKHFVNSQFADVAYTSPFYLKEFYSTVK